MTSTARPAETGRAEVFKKRPSTLARVDERQQPEMSNNRRKQVNSKGFTVCACDCSPLNAMKMKAISIQ
ncbi:MAG TPA: hypothetical protein VK968_02805 [Roseimicrobium sp.]|nr:hypothetical protein [Roseimicrobium sp.]